MTDNTLGNDDLSLNKLKIVALHKSIALYNLPDATDFTLYTITGQKIKEGSTNQDTYVIENETLPTGIYVLEIKDTNSNAVLKKKLVL
ncbi:T9SS type A sorting domain-containing protein [Geojedonia litorea]|uniref:T9SS type A sorting domain-containing protein n=1 Tax=Geojedonia litorea TaxID=1268269 RepID=A0ABV9N027_9FLAO